MLNIYVVSLIGASVRRASISEQFAQMNIDFQFFDAIDGRHEAHPLFAKQDLQRRQQLAGIPLLPGELGCFASHYLLWQRCCELDQAIVIIEDDAELKANFAEVYQALPELAERHEYLRLFENDNTYRKRVSVEACPSLDLQVVRYLKGPASTRAYMLRPSAAKKFIAHAQHWYKPVDDYMDEFWINQVACKGLVPGIVNDETHFASDIKQSVSGYKNRSLSAKAWREILRLSSDMQRLFYNWRA